MRDFKPVDYEGLGFKSGVEIHQQLLTERKLFCRCPAGLYSTEYDCEILRHMRPTLSELGEYDGTALMEFKTKKNVVYLLNSASVCTYEMDDTPPFQINQQALDIAIRISTLLGLSIVDELHIARKQYLDGSIPTGFQRTGIIGIEGKVSISNKDIRLIQLSIEEDSCREVSDVGHQITFRTDRLGMPLIEAVTYPDMKTPWEVAEAIDQIGRIMRRTKQVRRGLGSVRQDVNVSIDGGTRIEIKGVPRIAWVPALTHWEALRQKALLEIKADLIKRLGSKEKLRLKYKNLSQLFSQRGAIHPYLRRALNDGDQIAATRIFEVGDLLNYPTQPNKTFADEIRGRIRVIACIDQQPIMLHTQDYPKYEQYEKDLRVIQEAFGSIGAQDAIVLYAGKMEDILTAHQEIELRFFDAFDGVPSETRQPFSNGTTDFERILPGPDRMYPDTDLPPACITLDRVEAIRADNPTLPWVLDDAYIQMGIPRNIARQLTDSPFNALFVKIHEKSDVTPLRIATTFTQHVPYLQRQGFNVEHLSQDDWVEFFILLGSQRFHKEMIVPLLKEKCNNPNQSWNTILAKLAIQPVDESELETYIVNQRNQHFKPASPLNPIEVKKERCFMGKIMKKYRGCVSGARVYELYKKH
jgi:glutamyl-tRNA(Gln) amidotransferase subunit E